MVKFGRMKLMATTKLTENAERGPLEVFSACLDFPRRPILQDFFFSPERSLGEVERAPAGSGEGPLPGNVKSHISNSHTKETATKRERLDVSPPCPAFHS